MVNQGDGRQITGFMMQDARCERQETGDWSHNSEVKRQKAENMMHEARCRMERVNQRKKSGEPEIASKPSFSQW